MIIDIRFNSGGNSSLNDRLLSYITSNKYRQSSGRYWKVSNEVKQKIKNDSLWNDFLEESFLSIYVDSDNQSIIKNRSQISIPFTEIVRIKNMCQSTHLI